MELKSLKDIPVTFSIVKKALYICLGVSLLVSIGSMVWAYSLCTRYLNTTYIVTNEGKAIMLNSQNKYKVDQFRKPEIVNHIKEFHKLFFEIDQFNYEQRVNRSLYLIGNSGRDLYLTLKAKRYYSNIVANNLEHELQIDNIYIDSDTYPYRGEFYGKVIIKRTDQKLESSQKLHSSFELTNVARTEENPHGLLIENYTVSGM
ncbi:hypothetical protein [Fulvivirga sediminis]|uniref:Conjugative transposon protein TraK n=1 Tax=Fulvivirga sediminis TaxID=2803949 RepID=A0A937JZT0_9BACT|nr:hypothetical protein [Fulvivirga sediminis]MBL3657683.1 hypothetical protein [Fulvivirga sediminis]